MQSLDVFLDYWESARGRTSRVVACIPPEALETTWATGRWSLGDIVRHLAGIVVELVVRVQRERERRGHGNPPTVRYRPGS